MACIYYQEWEEDFDVIAEGCEKYGETGGCGGNVDFCPDDNGKDEFDDSDENDSSREESSPVYKTDEGETTVGEEYESSHLQGGDEELQEEYDYRLPKRLKVENEPDGFRGIPFGTHISQISDMVFQESYSVETVTIDDRGSIEEKIMAERYTRSNEKLAIGDAKLIGIEYSFYREKFFRVIVEFEGNENVLSIRETFTSLYGEGSDPGFTGREWDFDNVRIWLSVELGSGFEYKNGYVDYIFRPVFNEVKEEAREIQEKYDRHMQELRDAKARKAMKDL